MKNPKISPDTYQSYKAFMAFFFDKYFDSLPSLAPEDHPLAVLNSIEKTSLSNARKGLEMAINDCVEKSADWSAEKVAAADAELQSQGLISLTEVRQSFSKKYLRVLKRGSIQSEQEFYLIKSIVDGGSLKVGPIEWTQLTTMLEQYEK